MARVFMSHKVRDYDQWKQGYDADAERRKGAGFSEAGRFHSSEDRNSFLIVWDADMSADDARAKVSAMIADPELAALMEEAAVLEKPEHWVG